MSINLSVAVSGSGDHDVFGDDLFPSCAAGDEFVVRTLDREYRHELKINVNASTTLISIFKKLVPTQHQESITVNPRIRVINVNPFYLSVFDAEFTEPFFVQFADQAIQVERITLNINDVDPDPDLTYILK